MSLRSPLSWPTLRGSSAMALSERMSQPTEGASDPSRTRRSRFALKESMKSLGRRPSSGGTSSNLQPRKKSTRSSRRFPKDSGRLASELCAALSFLRPDSSPMLSGSASSPHPLRSISVIPEAKDAPGGQMIGAGPQRKTWHLTSKLDSFEDPSSELLAFESLEANLRLCSPIYATAAAANRPAAMVVGPCGKRPVSRRSKLILSALTGS
mmetsp:Transcript_58451/g.132358  ORF Transcript_58451/g.132358 Transcript_58451/m.132358 type:complete len:210 (-) Transcript_58451:48-677(-)